MATLALGGGGSSLTDIVGNNAIGSALGLTSGALTPLAFATKFGAGSVFQSSSLAYQIRARNNFDVIFHWFPKRSQIRSYFANAFTAADTDDMKFLIRSVQVPNFTNPSLESQTNGAHFKCAIPGTGVNGDGPMSIDFLATEFSFLDHIFYEWMCETESSFWIYADAEANYGTDEVAAFTRADIEIKYYSANNKELHSIICYGAFPTKITTMDVSNDTMFTAGYHVDFAFDSMITSSPFVDTGGWASKATGAIGSFASKVTGGTVGSNTAAWATTIQDDMIANVLNKSLLAKASGFMNSFTNKIGGKISGGLNSAQKAIGV